MRSTFMRRNLRCCLFIINRVTLRTKYSVFFLFFVCIQGYALEISPGSITFSVKDQKLKTVFDVIQQSSDYNILYSDNIIPDNQLWSLNVKDATIDEVMKKVLSNTSLQYTIMPDKQVVVSTAGTINVKGKVTDEKGNPIPEVSVTEKGTSNGVITNGNGEFSIQVSNDSATLEISHTSYDLAEVKLNGQTSVTVKLKEKQGSLEDVVVVGYGTQRKADLTGSIGVVKTEQAFKSRSATNVQELMAGTVPGLKVTKGSGAVGSGGSINIRGTSTIGSSSGVLVLIDGVPGNIYTLNPNDIESVSVLKDAASASIYGSRAANGVMLITTKSGRGAVNSRPVIEVNTSVGVQSPQFMLDFVGSEDFMKMWDQALVNDGKPALYGEQGIADLKAGKYADMQWYKEIYKKSSIINNNYLSISGKADYITYRLSGSYDYQDGTLPNNNYGRFVIRPDISIKLAKNLTLGANVQYTETKIRQPQGGTDSWQTQAARVSPVDFIYTKNGQYSKGSAMAGNPIAGVNESGYNEQKVKEMLNIFDLTYTPLKNWNIKGNFSYYMFDNITTNRINTYRLYNEDGSIYSVQNEVNGLSKASDNNWRNMLQLTTDYSFQVGDGNNFKVLAGYSQEYNKATSFGASRDNMPFPGIDVLDVGISNKQNNGTASDVAIQSLFARVNYDYAGKYLFQANIRGDGSSRFAPGHQWGYFPSFSVGWNMNKEKFLQDVSWLSQLKLRASWGMLGDAEKVGNYATINTLVFDPREYAFGGSIVPGAYVNSYVNPDITWETAVVSNIGIDASFFQQKLAFTIEYFINDRRNILYQPPVPTEFGVPGPIENVLEMRNQGMEASVSYNDSRGDFRWGIDANVSFSRNKVLDLDETGPWVGDNTYTAEGLRYNLPYGLEAIGLFQSADEITNSPNQGENIYPGNIKFKDQNKDNKIDGNDRIVLNENIVPVNYGANISFGWKDLDFSMNLYGTYNNYRYMQGYEGWAFYLSQNARPIHKDAWTPNNPDASYPRLTISNTANDTKYSNYWLRKASYLKLQNMQIGYTMPKELVNKMKLAYLRLFLSAQNLATLTKYPGFDPEGGYYPLSRTISFGVNLKF